MVVREGGLQVTPVCGGAPGERGGGRGGKEEERWRKRDGGRGEGRVGG